MLLLPREQHTGEVLQLTTSFALKKEYCNVFPLCGTFGCKGWVSMDVAQSTKQRAIEFDLRGQS